MPALPTPRDSRFPEASAPRFLKSCGHPGPRARGPASRTKFSEVEALGGRAGPGARRRRTGHSQPGAGPAPPRPRSGPGPTGAAAAAAAGAGRNRRGWSRPPPAPRRRRGPLPRGPPRSAGSGAPGASSAAVRSVLLPGQPHVGGRGRAGGRRRRRRLESPCWAATPARARGGRAAPRSLAPSRTLSQHFLSRAGNPRRPPERAPARARPAPAARARVGAQEPASAASPTRPRPARPRSPQRARPRPVAKARPPRARPPALATAPRRELGRPPTPPDAPTAPSLCAAPAPGRRAPPPSPLSGFKKKPNEKQPRSGVWAPKVQVLRRPGAMASPGSPAQPRSLPQTAPLDTRLPSRTRTRTLADTGSQTRIPKHGATQTHTLTHLSTDTLPCPRAHTHIPADTQAPAHPCTQHTRAHTHIPLTRAQVGGAEGDSSHLGLCSLYREGPSEHLFGVSFPSSLGSSHTQEAALSQV